MMLSPEKLLSMPPLMALKTMISEQWINSKPEWFDIKELRGNDSQPDHVVVVGLSNLHVPLNIRSKYADVFEYAFSKIDISILNNRGPLEIVLSPLKSKPSLIDALEDIFRSRGNLKFDSTDFIASNLELVPGPLQLTSSVGSYRWYGVLNLNVILVKEAIDKYVVRRQCILDHTPHYNGMTLKSEIVSSINRQNIGLLQTLISDEWCVLLPNTLTVVGNESDQLNTQITLSFNSVDSPYSGDIEILYGRKSFYTSFGHPVTIPSTITSNVTVLNHINSKLEAGLTLEDIDFPTVRPVGKHPLHINITSLAYVGTVWVHYE